VILVASSSGVRPILPVRPDLRRRRCERRARRTARHDAFASSGDGGPLPISIVHYRLTEVFGTKGLATPLVPLALSIAVLALPPVTI